MPKSPIFIEITLPYSGKYAEVKEGTGADLFAASRIAAGELTELIIQLIIRLCIIDNESISRDDLLEMHIRDVVKLQEIVELMLREL